MIDHYKSTPPKLKVDKLADRLERDVEKRFALKIKSIGGISWKFVSVNNRGVADRIVLYKGRTIYTELKRTSGKLSPLQKVFRGKVLDNLGEYVTIYGDHGVDNFIEQLTGSFKRFQG